MADFVAVLKKTIGGLNDNTPEMREKVYQRARDTVAAKLAAMDPPPSPIVAERQGQALEAAITAVEAGYAKPSDVGDEFDAIFSGSPVKTPDTSADIAVSDKTKAAKPAAESVAAKTSPEAPAPTPESRKRPSMFDAKPGDEELKPAEPVRRADPVLAGTSNFDDDSVGVAERKLAAPRKRGVSGGLIAALIALVVIAGAGYGIWANSDDFAALFAPSETVASAPASQEEPVKEKAAASEPAAAEEAKPEMVAAEPATEQEPEPAETQVASASEEPEKFTQRLTDTGEEVDPGPAGGQPSIGEGTSVAQATQPSGEPVAQTPAATTPGAAEPSKPAETALPVGQRAIFYEERTTVAESTADTGSTVWSVVQESPGGDLPPEPAIRAEVSIPSKNIQLRMTIRRNADPSLPASHIIEMIFLTSEGFEGGGIDNILRVAFKPSEAAAGNPLIGIPAKIADGYFLVALSSVEAEKESNLQLMRQQSWIDIPIVYSSGRRALVTMERGVPGDRVFIDTLQAWQNASSG